MGIFSLYKPKEYKYRYIYYDPKKEAIKEREKKIADAEKKLADGEKIPADYKPSIKRGTFRDIAQKSTQMRTEQIRQSNLRLVLIIALLLAIGYFLLK